MSVELVWITPEAERLLVKIAKVSNPAKQNEPSPRLLSYLIEQRHWSPFEMVNMCIEVQTTRDIGRQMLRHWTMRPQEFSQRYANVSALGDPVFREARLQHPSNRQQSVETDDAQLHAWWRWHQKEVWRRAEQAYQWALDHSIAKEVARTVLPEGMAPTRMYFNANLRSIIHFCQERTLERGAQKEIVEIAQQVRLLVARHMPDLYLAVWPGPLSAHGGPEPSSAYDTPPTSDPLLQHRGSVE